MHGIETEAKLMSGHFFRINPRRGTLLTEENVEIVKLIRIQIEALIYKIKALFFEEFGGDGCGNETEVLKKALALYFSSYNNETNVVVVQVPSLPLIFLRQLINIRKVNKEKKINANMSTNPH